MARLDVNPIFKPAFGMLPKDGVIIAGDDSVSVRVFGPDNNDRWSKIAMDHAIETAEKINAGGLVDATTTVENTRKGTEVVVVLHKKS